jgi:hypothetical protein
VATNTTQPEILITTFDTQNAFGFNDPITGELAVSALLGRFIDPATLQPRGEPFIILGDPDGNLDTHEVDYNPVTNQYVVVATAEGYRPQGKDIPLVALVDAGTGKVTKAFAYMADTPQEFDDVSVAVNPKNGDFLLIAEYDFPNAEGTNVEGVIAALFDKGGNLLTKEFGRIDTLEPDRDEDDPDGAYIPGSNVFVVITNIDPTTSPNLITATVVQPVPDASGNLQLGPQTIVSELRKDVSTGHADVIENPFNGEVIIAFNYNSGNDGGDLSYYKVGDNGSLTKVRDQVFYFDAESNFPFGHRHPQLAVDTKTGTIIVSHSARSGGIVRGMVFSLLGPDGNVLPGREEECPYTAAETETDVSDSANNHDVAYDPFSGSYMIVWTAGNAIQGVRVKVTSNYLPEDVNNWMMY